MKTTANKFRKNPHDVYAEAAKSKTVTINHDRYRDQVFELTARERNPLGDPDQWEDKGKKEGEECLEEFLKDAKNSLKDLTTIDGQAIAMSEKLSEIMKREGRDTFTWADMKQAQIEIWRSDAKNKDENN